mmetsp:Transcript_1778/g.5192  ORF Transcript_1778/g.5192 Transcript_1778/m.5192 type:complete len:281 (-) Transcript_1778:58-900(-)
MGILTAAIVVGVVSAIRTIPAAARRRRVCSLLTCPRRPNGMELVAPIPRQRMGRRHRREVWRGCTPTRCRTHTQRPSISISISTMGRRASATSICTRRIFTFWATWPNRWRSSLPASPSGGSPSGAPSIPFVPSCFVWSYSTPPLGLFAAAFRSCSRRYHPTWTGMMSTATFRRSPGCSTCTICTFGPSVMASLLSASMPAPPIRTVRSKRSRRCAAGMALPTRRSNCRVPVVAPIASRAGLGCSTACNVGRLHSVSWGRNQRMGMGISTYLQTGNDDRN